MTTPIQLPAGTNTTKCINLPTCGSWMGNIAVSLLTSANATIHELVFLYSNPPDGKRRYRRTGGTSGGGFAEWTLEAEKKFIRWLLVGESGMLIRYTATQEISLNVERTRSVKPYDYPAIPATAYPTQQTINIANAITGSIYWKP